jgi:transaldolase
MLSGYMQYLSVTGLSAAPTIFGHAIKNDEICDRAIQEQSGAEQSPEVLFFDLALADPAQAADLFRPIHAATGGVDGWVSLEISPLLVDDTDATEKAAAQLHARAQRPNLLIKVPGTPAGLPSVPINVTLLFSCEHYLAAAEAYTRGIERRVATRCDPKSSTRSMPRASEERLTCARSWQKHRLSTVVSQRP